MKHKIIFLLTLLLHTAVYSQQNIDRYIPETDPLVLLKLEQWQDLKFGLLMHWGPYSQWGIVESWSICSEDEGWCRRKSENYTDYKKEYENLQKTFNPVHFDPVRWARAAKEAGMKYLVFTTKHHDGFCMFDTKHTDYKITDKKTPFNTNPLANITKEIFDAFRAEGLWTGAYFSKPDWHSEYYWWPNFATPDRNVNYSVNNYPERWEKFVQYTHNQIMELMTDYGKLDILWLDGGWVKKRSDDEVKKAYANMNTEKPARIQNQDIRMDELVKKAREKQPGLIVVDRAVYGKNQNYLTPENTVPGEALPYPWESCIISGGGWSWTAEAKYMSGRKAVHMLVDIVAKGGNLLLNIAPGPDGRWDEGAYKLLEEIGEWLDINSEAIYGTRAIKPYKEGKICYTSKGKNKIFAIYLLEEGEEIPGEISIGGIEIPRGSRIQILGVESKVKWRRSGDYYNITVPKDKIPSCLAFTLKINLMR
ncbi:MAG TPA: alpha-L-fucosidase [Bacteroidales bacterium]|nr:alpha-L-fucosidase [Bacteroidales bacterium]